MELDFNGARFGTLQHILNDIDHLHKAITEINTASLGDKRTNADHLHMVLIKYLTGQDTSYSHPSYRADNDRTRLIKNAATLQNMLLLVSQRYEFHLRERIAQLKKEFNIDLSNAVVEAK